MLLYGLMMADVWLLELLKMSVPFAQNEFQVTFLVSNDFTILLLPIFFGADINLVNIFYCARLVFFMFPEKSKEFVSD